MVATVSEGVVGADVGRLALEPVDLTDLEDVVAGAAVEGGDGAVVVDGEEVVAAEAVDDEAAVDRGVVVDALDREGARGDGGRAGGGTRERRIGADGGEVAVEDGDEGGPVGVLLVGARTGRAGAGDRVTVQSRCRRQQAEDVVDAVGWAVAGVEVGGVDAVAARRRCRRC